MEDEQNPPPRVVTLDQVVAWNIAWYRREAGMKQADLAEKLGWPQNRVSEAERSWDGKRVREFNAQLLADLAQALGVPLNALFLPPEGERVLLSSARGDPLDMAAMMESLVMQDRRVSTAVMTGYRDRLLSTVSRLLDAGLAEEVGRWMRLTGGRELAVERAARMRAKAHALADAVAEHVHESLDLARCLEAGDGEAE